MPGFGKLVQRLPIIANACAWAMNRPGCAMVSSCCSHLLTSTIIYNDYPGADDSGHPCLKAPTTCDTCPGTQTHPHEPTSTHGPALSPTHPHHGATPTNTCSDARNSTYYHSCTHKRQHLRPLVHILMRPRTHRSRQPRQQSRRAVISASLFAKGPTIRSRRCRSCARGTHVRHGLRHGPYIAAGFVSRAVAPRNGADPGCRRQTLRKGGLS